MIVDINIRLSLDAEPSPEVRDALASLADVMLVQAEDGLYRLGWKDAEDEVIENTFLGEFSQAHVTSIEIEEDS